MNYRSIIKIISLVSITLSGIFFLDVCVAFLFDEVYKDLLFYNVVLLLINFFIVQYLKNERLDLKIRDSILVVNILWILLGLYGAIPFYIYTDISFSSAFFEAISGFTTTGATIYTDIESLPHIILFHRSLTHYLGGLGVIVLGVGLLSMINPTGSLSLFKAEATGVQIEKVTPKIKDTALSLWIIYSLLTFLDILFLKFFGLDWFDAINHAFSTISTGGFSTKNDSFASFEHDGIIWTTTIFMILSGINFLAHLKLFHRDFSGYKSEEVRIYLQIFFVLSIALAFVHIDLHGSDIYETLKYSFFTIASILTTTGFVIVDYNEWSHFAISLIFIAMFIGGNAGSTSGGIKVIRQVILFKTLFAEFRRTLHPHSIVSVFIDNHKQDEKILTSVFGFFVLFMLSVILVSIYIYARGYDAMSAISTGFAVVGNIGPGFSLVGPVNNFAFFSDFDKIFLSIFMIIGRLECYTVYILFSISFWKKF